MIKVYAEGVDYSRTSRDDWDMLANIFVANGYKFAGRYAVHDKSPNGRGITGAEYRALLSHGIDVFLYYEEDEGWMLGGWDAGVRAANRALDVVLSTGMPVEMPVYYSHDIGPQTIHFDVVDACLRGAASVVGLERVGLYGGWEIIDHCQKTGSARWFTQTIAWQGNRGVHPAANLHQYNTGTNLVGGVNCDFVAAVNPAYGGAKEFLPTTTKWAKPLAPPLRNGEPYSHIDSTGIVWLELAEKRWRALENTARRRRASNNEKEVGPPIEKGETVTFLYSVHMPTGITWFVSRSGSRCRADAFVPKES